MPHGYKREYNDIFYFKKYHFCPDCKIAVALLKKYL